MSDTRWEKEGMNSDGQRRKRKERTMMVRECNERRSLGHCKGDNECGGECRNIHRRGVGHLRITLFHIQSN